MNRSRLALLVSLVVAVLGVTATAATPASAHEGEGVLTLESQQPAADGAVAYVVRLTWANDGHAAIDSTVTATPISPEGVPQTPITFSAIDQDGRYGGSVVLTADGAWTVRFTAVTPAATAEMVEEVILPETTTTTTVGETVTTVDAGADEPATVAEVEDAAPDPEGDGGDGSGGSSMGGILAVGVLVLLVAAAALGFAKSTRRLRDGP